MNWHRIKGHVGWDSHKWNVCYGSCSPLNEWRGYICSNEIAYSDNFINLPALFFSLQTSFERSFDMCAFWNRNLAHWVKVVLSFLPLPYRKLITASLPLWFNPSSVIWVKATCWLQSMSVIHRSSWLVTSLLTGKKAVKELGQFYSPSPTKCKTIWQIEFFKQGFFFKAVLWYVEKKKKELFSWAICNSLLF